MLCSNCSHILRPIVVSDIDGTLSQYHEDITRFSSRYFDKAPPTFAYDGFGPFRDYLELTQAEHRAMKLAYRQGGNKRFVKPYPNAREVLSGIRSYGVEIWVATTRPWQRLDNVDPDTREWLRRNGIEIDGLLYGDDKYEQLIETVDKDRIVACFEDLPQQMSFGSLLDLPMYQIYRPHNETTSARWQPGGSLPEAGRWALERLDVWRDLHAAR